MGAAGQVRGGALVAMAALAIAGGSVRADPVGSTPTTRRGALGDRAAILAELAALAVVDAARPGEIGSVDEGMALSRLRVGAMAWSGAWTGVARLDVAAALRAHVDPGDAGRLATAGAIVDDAYLSWRPRRWVGVVAGRQELPFSRFRQIDDARLTGPGAPTSIADITPDRRWGLGVVGDLGAIGYAGGLYADGSRFERLGDADPSRGGRLAAALHGEWTPRAPRGRSFLSTPRSDPWFDTWRISLGAGVLYRMRDDGDRVDLSASVQNQWRALGSVAEVIVSRDRGATTVAAAGELSSALGDRVAVFARGDVASTESFAAGGGALLWLERDRRARLALHAWLGRGDERSRRAVVVELRGSL